METIEFSCDERLLETARQRARVERTSLRYKFHEWLESYARSWRGGEAGESDGERRNFVDVPPDEAQELLKHYPTPDGRFTRGELAVATARVLRARHPVPGRKYTRDEMNER